MQTKFAKENDRAKNNCTALVNAYDDDDFLVVKVSYDYWYYSLFRATYIFTCNLRIVVVVDTFGDSCLYLSLTSMAYSY